MIHKETKQMVKFTRQKGVYFVDAWTKAEMLTNKTGAFMRQGWVGGQKIL